MGTMIISLDYLNPVPVQAPRLGRRRQILTLPATAGTDRVRTGLPAGTPPDRRPVFHLAVRDPYNRLNDAVCADEIRAPSDPSQTGPNLVIDITELIWEPIADGHADRSFHPPAEVDRQSMPPSLPIRPPVPHSTLSGM